jgi:Carboxypeptidase regulatory-like domain/TonB dependent receptor
MKKRVLCPLSFAVALVLSCSTVAFSQADVSTATLKGTITDPSGALVAGAQIRATNTERGTVHEATTDSLGVYQIPFLQPGTYDLRIETKGFETTLVKGVELSVGLVAVIDVLMKVGAVATEVLITAEAPLVEVEKTQQANTINSQQIENLPNITRNAFNFVYTLPGVSSSVAPRNQGNGAFNFGTSGYSIGGSNGRSNLITVDGGENEFGDGEPRFLLGPEVVQEFQVNRNAFGAEFGFTSGTAVNLVTKSGTNTFHGSVYSYYRSQHTSARNFFDNGTKKAFDQQIYPGFTLGGPMVRNKLFFFTSFEALKSDTARFRSYPATPAELGLTASQSAYFNALANSSNPALQRDATGLVAAFNASLPTTVKFFSRDTGGHNAPSRIYTWSTRIDYQIGQNDSISGRFTLFHSDADQTGNLNTVGPSNATNLFARDYTTVVSWLHNFSPSLINQTRVQFAPKVSSRTIPNDPTGAEIIVSGIGTFGRTFTGPFNTFENRSQFEDTLSWIKGRHSVKLGASYRPVKYRVIDELWFGGQWTFQALPVVVGIPAADQAAFVGFNLANGFPSTGPNFSAVQSLTLGIPVTVRQGFGNPAWEDWTHFFGLFAQDSWKISPRFTLDYGLRYEYDREPKPLSTYNNVAPRLGLAWDPFGDQKTVIRAGAGIFYAPALYQVDYLTNLLNDSGRYINQTLLINPDPSKVWAAGVKSGKLPFVGLSAQDYNALGFATGPKNSNRVIFEANPNYKNTYTGQISFGITRQVVRDLSLDVAYQMYRGVHIQLDHEINYRPDGLDAATVLKLPANEFGLLGPHFAKIDPTIAQFNQYSSIGNSIYHGMTVSLTKRYSAYSQFQVNYTFSKTIDDVTDYNSGFAAFIPTNLRLERALSSFDIRHNFVANGVFRSPFQAGSGHNILSRAFADMTLSPIIFLRSGIPFTVLVSQGDVNGDTHTNDRPFYAARNTGLGEPYYDVDLRLNKQFFIRRDSGLRVEFIAEATNLFNHTNFLSVNNFVGTDLKYLGGPFNLHGDRSLPSTSPLGFTSAGDPRRIQLALKIAF